MAKKLFDTVRYTSVGLFRMGRDSVRTLFDKAYTAGKTPVKKSTVPVEQPTEQKPSDT